MNPPSAPRLELDLQRYAALLEMTDLVSSRHEPADLFRDLAPRLRSVVAFDFINFALHDPVREIVNLCVWETGDWPAMPVEVPVEDAAEGWVWRNQAAISIDDLAAEERFEPGLRGLRERELRSYCAFPLTTSHERLGALGFGSKDGHAFDSQDIAFLQRVSELVALCVDNTLTQASLIEERERVRLLLEIDAFHTHQGDLHESISTILGRIQRWTPHDLVGLYVFDESYQSLRLHMADAHLVERIAPRGKVPLEGTLAGQAFRNCQVEVFGYNDLAQIPQDSVKRGLALGVRSLCLVPLLGAMGPLGVLKVASRIDRGFPARVVELLTQVATAIVPVLQNVVTQRTLQRERQRMQALLNISDALASQREVREVFPQISAFLRRVLRHEYASFGLYDERKNIFVRQALDFPLGMGFLREVTSVTNHGPQGRALAERKVLMLSENELTALRSEPAGSGVGEDFFAEGLKSLCCIPLIRPRGALGMLSLASTRADAFKPEDKALLNQVGTQLAIALENARVAQQLEELKIRLAEEKRYLEGEIRTELNFEEIVGESPALKKVLDQVTTVAASDATVLILGETGTGKELIARAVHRMSRRKERAFVKVNCAAIPSGLLESELFGHEKGAFTGAVNQKIGRLELANQGTLFLDEVGEIPLELQPKLLRVLQDHEFERLGGIRTIKVNLRLIAATNRDLPKSVSEQKFRSDLFYRLNVFPIRVPPLRDRRPDIPMLVRYFVHKYAPRMDRQIETIPSEAMAALTNYPWPGNVRELENLIERSVILSEGSALHVPLAELHAQTASHGIADHTLESAEREHIVRVLRETGGLISGPTGAARKLGVKRTTLQSKMQRLEITRKDYAGPKQN